MTHDCKYEETIGRFKEFMDTTKGMKATLFIVAVAILTQVGTFLFLWGGLTETVKRHDKFIAKFDNVKIVSIAYADNGLKK